jgi:FlaA1/EpsC-like NDP-sugar epimerase
LTLGMSGKSNVIFSTVRFGNVLGSNGSVVPLFLSQIKAGGPVTLTHPDVKRYFMLIPEAVQLLLHAAAHSERQTIHLLQMGDEIKLLDLARNLIRLSGFVPERDIPIKYVGLRPGEKLSEELFGTDEEVEPSSVEKVLRVRPKSLPNVEQLLSRVSELEHVAQSGDSEAMIQLLCKLVPTFKPIALKRKRPADVVPLTSKTASQRSQ